MIATTIKLPAWASLPKSDKNLVKAWLDSPALNSLRVDWANEDLKTKAFDQAWWDSLTTKERARAFRQVVSLIYKAEVQERRSYRHTMYEVFEVDYIDGMTCHYMDIHNLIYKALDASSPVSSS